MIALAILQILIGIISVPLLVIGFLWVIIYNSIHSIKIVNDLFKAGNTNGYGKFELWLIMYLYGMRKRFIDLADIFTDMLNKIAEK